MSIEPFEKSNLIREDLKNKTKFYLSNNKIYDFQIDKAFYLSSKVKIRLVNKDQIEFEEKGNETTVVNQAKRKIESGDKQKSTKSKSKSDLKEGKEKNEKRERKERKERNKEVSSKKKEEEDSEKEESHKDEDNPNDLLNEKQNSKIKLYLADCSIVGCSMKNMNYEIVNELNSNFEILVLENDKPYLTSNLPLLYALNKGKIIVTKKWLKDSALKKEFLPVKNYLFRNKDIEKKYNFSLDELYKKNRSTTCSYLKGFKFYVSDKISYKKEICMIIESAKGKILSSIPDVIHEEDKFYILLKKLEEGYEFYNDYIIYSDVLLNSVIKQKFEVDDEDDDDDEEREKNNCK